MVLPALDTAAVTVRAECEAVIARVADAQAVSVGDGVGGGDGCGGRGGAPMAHEEGLCGEEVRVSARAEVWA